MNWTNCNEELPPAKTDIWVKYKNMKIATKVMIKITSGNWHE